MGTTNAPQGKRGDDCATWCNDHKTDVDRVDATEISEICRREVTFGDVSVKIEDSPAWRDDPKWGGPIAVPDLIEVGPADARDFAAALIEAARLYEDDRP